MLRQLERLSDSEIAHIEVVRVHRDGIRLHTVECQECHFIFQADAMVVHWGNRLLCAWCVRDLGTKKEPPC